MEKRKATSVYIVEDSEVVRAVIREMLTLNPDIVVAGESGNGETAVREALSLKPQVMIVDIGLPGLDGIQVMKKVKAQLPELRAIMLTSHDNDNSMFAAFSAGAAAYLVKNQFNSEKLVKAVSDVQSGSAWFDPAITRQFLKSAATQESNKLASLSDEEKRILRLVAEQTEPEESQPSELDRSDAPDNTGSAVAGNHWNAFLKKLERFKE